MSGKKSDVLPTKNSRSLDLYLFLSTWFSAGGTYINTRMCVHRYTRVCIHTVYIHIHICIQVCICVYIHTYVYICVCIWQAHNGKY